MSFWGVVAVGATALAFVVLWPQVRVDSQSPLDPKSAFSVPFVVHNETAVISLRNVQVVCDFTQIKYSNPRVQIRHTTLTDDRVVDQIRSGNAFVAFCPWDRTFRIPGVIGVDLTIHVTFTTRPLFFHVWRRDFHFLTIRTDDGQLHWVPAP